MAGRKLGMGTTVVVVVAFFLLIGWAYSVYGDDDLLPTREARQAVATTTTPAPAPTTVAPAPAAETAAPLLPANAAPVGSSAVGVVVPPSEPVVGVVVDHDVTGIGTPQQQWILQVFDRETDSMRYVFVPEAVWRACPVPGEFVGDRCVDVRTYEPELPTPQG